MEGWRFFGIEMLTLREDVAVGFTSENTRLKILTSEHGPGQFQSRSFWRDQEQHYKERQEGCYAEIHVTLRSLEQCAPILPNCKGWKLRKRLSAIGLRCTLLRDGNFL